jgi:glycosyltransferase involved in cell wall biosynthesis
VTVGHVAGRLDEADSLSPTVDFEVQPPSKDAIVDVSVVIPVFNEEENLTSLCERCSSSLAPMNRPYEIIMVDDGSTDGSFRVMRQIAATNPKVRLVRLRRNFGQTAAFSAGFERAAGRIVVTMDADLQNDPADIPRLVDRLEEGEFDIVSGWRKRRQDALWTRRVPSIAANRLIAWITGVKLHDFGCSLKAYRASVLQGLRLYGEMHRFIPAAASWTGITIGELPVDHHPRRFGKSKYGLSRIVKVVLDLIVLKFLLSYSGRPMRVFGSLGLLTLLSGLAIGVYLSLGKLFFAESLSDRPLLILAISLITFGAQFFTTGLLSEILMRTYYEAQGKKTYVVRDEAGWPTATTVAQHGLPAGWDGPTGDYPAIFRYEKR